jgi:uncharacterized protein
MILKILLIVGLIAAIYFIFIKKKPQQVQETKDANKKDVPRSNEMVECSTCQIYCSLDDVLLSNGKYYCSKECLEKSK